MAPKTKKQNEELESQLLNLLKGTIGGMDKKIDRIDRRISKLENAVFPAAVPSVPLPPWYRDTQLLKLLTLLVAALIIVLTIIASLHGIKLPSFGVMR